MVRHRHRRRQLITTITTITNHHRRYRRHHRQCSKTADGQFHKIKALEQGLDFVCLWGESERPPIPYRRRSPLYSTILAGRGGWNAWFYSGPHPRISGLGEAPKRV